MIKIFRRKNQNQFGKIWERIQTPVEGVVAAIDKDGYNCELYRVGLSAMQLDNLGIERTSEPLNAQTLVGVINASKRGLLDGQDYGRLNVGYKGRVISALVYNAFGLRSVSDDEGIRISSILAEDLGVGESDRVELDVKKVD